jgi:ubiquinone/menaquinone biosynthesis C-methylase UbiE
MDLATPYAAKEMYQRAGWTIAFTAVFFYINYAEYPGPALTISLLLVLLTGAFIAAGYGLHWVATTGQQMLRDQTLDAAALAGSERVLCLGQDLALAAGKRMKSGKIIAVGETAENEAARETAKNLGLQDRVRFEAGDVGKLTYPDSNFDVVLTSRAFEGLSAAEMTRGAQELARVLKPGGRCVVHAVGDWNQCVSVLQDAVPQKFHNVTAASTSLPLGLGGRIISCQKVVG